MKTFILLVIVAAVTSHFARASSATWAQSPGNTYWDNSSNWVPMGVPNGPGDVATFSSSSETTIVVRYFSDIEVRAMNFVGPDQFTIIVAEPASEQARYLTISGEGIDNHSGAQSFVSHSTDFGHGQFHFTNSASAGYSTRFTVEGVSYMSPGALWFPGVRFSDTASAGDASFSNEPAGAPDAN